MSRIGNPTSPLSRLWQACCKFNVPQRAFVRPRVLGKNQNKTRDWIWAELVIYRVQAIVRSVFHCIQLLLSNTIPCQARPCHTITGHIISCHMMPDHTVPYHTMPGHTRVYHDRPYCSMVLSRTKDLDLAPDHCYKTNRYLQLSKVVKWNLNILPGDESVLFVLAWF